MDSMERKNNAANPPSISEPTSILQSPPTVVANGQGVKLKQKQIEDALIRARKNLTDEDFVQALSIIDVLLQTEPDLGPAKALRDQIQQAASNRSREIFNQGVNCYMECDWDRATALWKKTLQIVPDDATVLEWITRAERKKERERVVRAELLQELEECGKMLSERNYVVAEDHLETLKNKFTGGFRLADLQKIYEALVVRTRVELEKEFEDLRSNIVEPVQPRIVEKQSSREPVVTEDKLQKEYMDAFEAGKKYFENGEWQNALGMWQTARRINPQDVNLTHWIALAENNAIQGTPYPKPSPVRATIAFLSVFFVTAIITYFAYQKYVEYSRETKNRNLVQRAMEHYRAGRLEESWKMLQIYVLHDPDNESARTLLERITAEMNVRKSMESRYREMDMYLQNAREERKAQSYAAALQSYQKALEIDSAHPEALQEYDQLRKIVDSTQTEQKVTTLLREGEALLAEHQLDPAAEKLNEVLALHPGEATAQALLNRIEAERNHLNRIAVQLEVARYLYERNQKESAALVLNRILLVDPGQPQAKQLLSRVRGASSTPKASLEIRIQPAARLWIDGRDLGINSYFNYTETIGTHIIHIEMQGFHNLDQGIEVKSSGKNAFQFQLKRM